MKRHRPRPQIDPYIKYRRLSETEYTAIKNGVTIVVTKRWEDGGWTWDCLMTGTSASSRDMCARYSFWQLGVEDPS